MAFLGRKSIINIMRALIICIRGMLLIGSQVMYSLGYRDIQIIMFIVIGLTKL